MHNELSLTAAAASITAGEITSEELVRDCLDRIEARDGVIRAWAFIDPELALAQAHACDRAPDRLGLLHGVPVGIKDIIETADMPTGMGSPIYDGHQTPNDAACVALMRHAGAVILGKTVTAEFAGLAPAPTRNPHDTDHTTGGSSSGSAAAVADFMVPAAFGTQTAASVHRPAGYCGIIGFKPTFGTFNLQGVRPAAQTLDTLGLLTRSLADVELISAVLTGRPPRFGGTAGSPPRLGLCRTHLWRTARPETVEAVEDSADRLAAKGAQIVPFDLPDDFAGLPDARNLISAYERSRATAWEFFNRGELLSRPLYGTVERGLRIPWDDYAAAKHLAADCRLRLVELFDGVDALIAPLTEGEAPRADEDKGGDHAFIGFWNLLQAPSYALPTHTGQNGLPVGIHLIGAHGEDAKLGRVANWVLERVLEHAHAH